MAVVEQLRFLSQEQVHTIAKKFGTPTFVYSEDELVSNARQALNFNAPYGLTVRFAMKANPNQKVLKILNSLGIAIDASSGYEASRAIKAGIEPKKILLTAQELPENLSALLEQGIEYNACSLHQLETYGKLRPGTDVSIRINPGAGAGTNNRLITGGSAASFGIWYEYINDIKKIAQRYKLSIVRVHSHVGTGGDPVEWGKIAVETLKVIHHFPDTRIFNIGGGFKTPYMNNDKALDINNLSQAVATEIKKFADRSGKKLKLEIEPGRLLAASAGAIVCQIQDMSDSGGLGYEFIKLNTGMSEIIRPAMYGAQHPIVVVGKSKETREYLVAGHCCETGDTLTTAAHDPEKVEPRLLHKAEIGDLVVVEMAGAYCASCATINYNSFPQAAEVIITHDGQLELIRRRQTFDEMLSLEEVN